MDDVRPILERRCLKCHAGEGAAAGEHDFSQVQTLLTQKTALASEIVTCAMPPSPEPPVADAEAEALLRWVACGGISR
jgi:cytochrome c551/c552